MNRLEEVIQEMNTFIEGFEVRQQQFDMMKSVYEAMITQKKAAVHAPTGTGKSFGYLLPFVATKLDNPEFRITINTHTIALQAQLQKDIAVADNVYRSMLRKMKRTTMPLNVVTLKGNGNYFCEHRFNEAKDDQLPFGLADDVLERLKTVKIRDKQHLNMDMAPSNWEKMNVDGCLKRACPFKETCTYFNHYSKINTFDIVIANHALFFYRFLYSDQFWEGFNFHVFDESHKLERGLLDASTYSLTMRQIDGWLFQGAKFGERMRASAGEVEAWRKKYTEHPTYIASKERFESFGTFFKPPNTASTIDKMDVKKRDIQLWVKDLQEWQKAFVKEMTEEILAFVPDKEEDEAYKRGRESWIMSLMALHEFGTLSNNPDDIGVLWVEMKKKTPQLLVTPNSIDHIRSPFVKGVLLTSGTIAQNHSCQAIARRLNVKIDSDLVLSTPFPLAEQTLVHFSDSVQPKMQNWESYLKEEIFRSIQAGKQKTFVLFTANKVMERIYNDLLPRLYDLDGEKPLEVWKQEDGNYQDVVASFQNPNVRSILFGSKTYFEGIDLKGENLTQVILTRLPYSVPNHPIQEILERKTGYGQWEAQVNFEQAFGRLIRTSNDYGVFHVLDSRVSYLKQFKELFEDASIPMTERIEDVYQFYREKKTLSE